MRFWLRFEWRRYRDDGPPPPATPPSVFEQYVRAEQQITNMAIALAELEQERDQWRAAAERYRKRHLISA